jgi:hypothetical protein
MTQAFFGWWWDAVLGLPRAQVIVGVASIAIGIWLGVLAYRIAKKQKEMQEEEHKFFREQRDNKPSLKLWVTGMQQDGSGTLLTFSIHNTGKSAANGFAWEIVVPYTASSVASFRTAEGDTAPVKITTDFAKQAPINFFRKDTREASLFVGDMVDVAWLAVVGGPFQPFQIQWRIYTGHGTVPETGHNTISVAPRPQGLLDVQPVLTIPAVTPGKQPTLSRSTAAS